MIKIRNKSVKYILINKLNKDINYTVEDHEEKIFLICFIEEGNQTGKINVLINGKHAMVKILGIIVGSGNQTINLHTLQDHLQGESKSDLFIKSVLFDEAKFSYQGMVRIRANAQKSDAYQKNLNLLLSDKAGVLTAPNLEILANDVYCTHGSATGKIDQDQLSYLLSRGLDKKDATKLMVNGFFQEILMKVPDDGLKKELEERIDKKMNELIIKFNY